MSASKEHTEEETEDLPDSEAEAAEAPVPLKLEVQIASPGACQRHITVTIPREEIDRYFDKAFGELMPTAAVPGFRAGRAPRKLVEHRFRKDVADKVKGSLLMDSLGQVSEENKLSAISEPDLDVSAVELPDEGPLTYEFDLEVRPEFDLPQWKGFTIERPGREFTSKDIDAQLRRMLANRGRLVPHDGPASKDDHVTANLTLMDGERVVHESRDVALRLADILSFRDGRIEGFAKGMKGVKAGESRTLPIHMSDAAGEALRGKELAAKFDVLEVKKLELPELTPELLMELGDFDSEGALRDALRDSLERQLKYHQQQRARKQITGLLTAAANWDLPPGLLRRQSRRELERAKLELQRNGFSDEQVQAHENLLRQNTLENTARLLKEHFILERIAEEENLEENEADYDEEIRLIADQSGESPRRVRAQLEQRDLMDVLRNQIIERKVVDLVHSHAKFKDVPFELEGPDTEALDRAISGEESDIPEAKHGGEAEPLPGALDRHP
jgi:trigger factor